MDVTLNFVRLPARKNPLLLSPVGPTGDEGNAEEPVAMLAVEQEGDDGPHHRLVDVVLEDALTVFFVQTTVADIEREKRGGGEGRSGGSQPL